MAKIGFRLKVKQGFEEQYIKAHQEVWPELLQVVQDAGIHNYSIFIDGQDVFLYCEVDGTVEDFVAAWKKIQATEVSRRWSEAMSKLLEPARGIGEEAAPPMMQNIFYLE